MTGLARNPTQDVMRNIRALRLARGWSVQELSNRLADAGLDLDRPVVAKLEIGYRQKLTVAELFAFAHVFGVEPMDLVDCCPRCLGTPPAGFRCLDCHREGGAA